MRPKKAQRDERDTNLKDLAKEIHNFPHVLKPRTTTSTHQSQIAAVVGLQHFQYRDGVVPSVVITAELSRSEIEHHIRRFWEFLLRDEVEVDREPI